MSRKLLLKLALPYYDVGKHSHQLFRSSRIIFLKLEVLVATIFEDAFRIRVRLLSPFFALTPFVSP